MRKVDAVSCRVDFHAGEISPPQTLLYPSVDRQEFQAEELKRSSSMWISERFPHLSSFSWQAGYGAFSVSVSSLDSVLAYIGKQEEHHATVSFQDEFRKFLKKHELDCDERFAWN